MNQPFQYDTELKLGQNRGKPRVWIEGRKLAEAGFLPGERFEAHFEANQVTLVLALPNIEGESSTTRTVSGKERESGPHPIIDMNTAELGKYLPNCARIAVRMTPGKIVITPARTLVQKAARVATAVAVTIGLFAAAASPVETRADHLVIPGSYLVTPGSTVAASLLSNAGPLLVSLCDYSGSWSQPYVEAGWRVIRVDLGHPAGEHLGPDGVLYVGADVRYWRPKETPDAVLAAPPCTVFCRPAARWWARQDKSGQTTRDVEVMRAALSIAKTAKVWWALENPPGRHQQLIPELGKPAWQFQPWQYGDPWGKQTYIWGTALQPPITNPVACPPTRRTPNGKTQGVIAFMSSAWKREREKTPPGFAAAFAARNSHPLKLAA